ncbi:uroporphyrinogen-III synthase [Staphylococcus lutrae]|uniref:Uroporphyrinogen-III synthase n=1 Tax=Staphylococcus lutrae TaxID=155085 RepID=A0AAC9WI93_9STAP|nr:uroporphyrinogen-III synthase [Staphylococcus lutrae]ARJ49964.1 uroporphyrinogen III synthase [Staphylococcus lutrae]PNZ38895.1 uroporphyrinogen-III synthase [Staphylococcus lutrae]
MKPTVVMSQTHHFNDERAKIVHLPFKSIQPLTFDQSILDNHYHWLVFTSKNAVAIFLPYLKYTRYERLAVIGEKTKEYCEKQGLQVDFYPNDYSQEGFLEMFSAQQGERILIPSSIEARPLLYEALGASGLQVTKIDLYEAKTVVRHIEKTIALIARGEIDAVTFASASAVRAFFERYHAHTFTRFYAIGQQTAHVIQSYGYPCSIADIQTLEAMITKIIEERVH